MFRNFLIFMSIIGLFVSCSNDASSVKSIDDLQQRVAKLNKLNENLEGKRQQMFAFIREYNTTQPDSAQIDITALDTLMGAPEKELLKSMFNEEKDISYTGLLKDIVAKNEEIVGLNDEIARIREHLPVPYCVKPGDTHYNIVLNYLMNEYGLTQGDALKVAWRTALIDEILPNNEIWLMYRDGVVGSFVTQGTATISPMTVHVLAKQRLIDKIKMDTRLMPVDSTIKKL